MLVDTAPYLSPFPREPDPFHTGAPAINDRYLQGHGIPTVLAVAAIPTFQMGSLCWVASISPTGSILQEPIQITAPRDCMSTRYAL